MQLGHDDMCDVFNLNGNERDTCRFGTFEPDFLHVQYVQNLWEITIIDAKVRFYGPGFARRSSTLHNIYQYSL